MDKKAVQLLSQDKTLAQLISSSDLTDLPPSKVSLLEDIIDSIISQQLSGKAAKTIFGRFNALLPQGRLTPQSVLKLSDDKMRRCGISFSKIKYIKGICQAIINKELDLELLKNKSDEEVIAELIKQKGIGRWTAEMILIFSLNRPDVFSIGDLGLRTAVAKYYNLDREDLKSIEKVSLSWSPYRTLASRLLWNSLNNK